MCVKDDRIKYFSLNYTDELTPVDGVIGISPCVLNISVAGVEHAGLLATASLLLPCEVKVGTSGSKAPVIALHGPAAHLCSGPGGGAYQIHAHLHTGERSAYNS